MYLKKTYIFLFIALLNIILLQAQEDLSVNVVLEDRNITIEKLKSSKIYFDRSYHEGYSFIVNISIVNKTTKIKHLKIHNMCGYSTWKTEGDAYIRRIAKCLKNVYRNITLSPKESFDAHLPLWFPEVYLNKKLSFKIGFNEILRGSFEKYKYIKTYWSETITINEKAEDVSKIKNLLDVEVPSRGEKSKTVSTSSQTGGVSIIKTDLTADDIPQNVKNLMIRSGARNLGEVSEDE